MASNTIPRVYEPLVSLATDALDGATTHGAAVGLKQNTAAAIQSDYVALVGDPDAAPPVPGAQALLAAAKSARAADGTALRTVTSNGRAQVATCVDTLRKPLGRSWNAKWEAAGFVNHSLAVPRSAARARGARLPSRSCFDPKGTRRGSRVEHPSVEASVARGTECTADREL